MIDMLRISHLIFTGLLDSELLFQCDPVRQSRSTQNGVQRNDRISVSRTKRMVVTRQSRDAVESALILHRHWWQMSLVPDARRRKDFGALGQFPLIRRFSFRGISHVRSGQPNLGTQVLDLRVKANFPLLYYYYVVKNRELYPLVPSRLWTSQDRIGQVLGIHTPSRNDDVQPFLFKETRDDARLKLT